MRLPFHLIVAGAIGMGALPTGGAPATRETSTVRVAPASRVAFVPRVALVSRVAQERTSLAADSVREYRGLYETGFEVSWFHPCEAQPGDDMWWVTLTDAALKQRDSLAAKLKGQPGAVFVRWRGTTSAKMQAGHMGRGTRYMLVHEVLELRPASEAGCATT